MKTLRREATALKEVVDDLTLENRIPKPIHDQIIEMALEESDLSPIIGWSWVYLWAILADFSRYVIAWSRRPAQPSSAQP